MLATLWLVVFFSETGNTRAVPGPGQLEQRICSVLGCWILKYSNNEIQLDIWISEKLSMEEICIWGPGTQMVTKPCMHLAEMALGWNSNTQWFKVEWCCGGRGAALWTRGGSIGEIRGKPGDDYHRRERRQNSSLGMVHRVILHGGQGYRRQWNLSTALSNILKTWTKKKPDTRTHTVWFHSSKVRNQAKLVSSWEATESGPFGRTGSRREMRKGFWFLGIFRFLTCRVIQERSLSESSWSCRIIMHFSVCTLLCKMSCPWTESRSGGNWIGTRQFYFLKVILPV